MTITAKFAATCTACQQRITPGQQIEWSKGAPVRHTSCDATTTATRPTRRDAAPRYGSYATIGARTRARQRATGWTGCRCGSIEDMPRASDCADCRHAND